MSLLSFGQSNDYKIQNQSGKDVYIVAACRYGMESTALKLLDIIGLKDSSNAMNIGALYSAMDRDMPTLLLKLLNTQSAKQALVSDPSLISSLFTYSINSTNTAIATCLLNIQSERQPLEQAWIDGLDDNAKFKSMLEDSVELTSIFQKLKNDTPPAYTP